MGVEEAEGGLGWLDREAVVAMGVRLSATVRKNRSH